MSEPCPKRDEGVANSVTVAHSMTCVLLKNQSVKCFGLNHFGNLGLEDTRSRGPSVDDMGDNLPYVNVGTGRTVVQVSAGGAHVCALLDNGKIKCWGENEYGAVGLNIGSKTETVGDAPNSMGDNLPYTVLGPDGSRKATKLEVGSDHNCALMNNNQMYCWGSNNFGQLGLGDVEDRGVNDGEMANLVPVDLPPGEQVLQMALGYGHTCVLTSPARSVYCWGLNYQGQLGVGNDVDQGDKPGDMGENLKVTRLGVGVAVNQISAGEGFTCAVLEGGSLKCWGLNTSGQLGLGHTDSMGDDPNRVGDSLPPVSLPTGLRALKVDTGAMHTCVLCDDHQLYCWGDNSWGQLGRGDTKRRGISPDDMGDNLRATVLPNKVKDFSVGDYHTCAVLEDSSLVCWGRNEWGYLGHGDRDNKGDEANEMGENLKIVLLNCNEDINSPTLAPTAAPTRYQDELGTVSPNDNTRGGEVDAQGSSHVIGIVVGLVALMAVVGVGLAYRNRKKKKDPLEDEEPPLDVEVGQSAQTTTPDAMTQV